MKPIIQSKRWSGDRAPGKILVIRFHALGDTMIILPYLQDLKKRFPECKLHFLTRDEVSPIPGHLGLFERMFVTKGRRSAKLQLFLTLLKLPLLFTERYDAVLDLQNNKISRLIRKLLFVKAWSAFDRYSPVSAGERTRQTIEALWRWKIYPDHNLLSDHALSEGKKLLTKNGLMPGNEIVILNPAGFCASRNWPLHNYVEFAHLWREKISSMTQFVLLLLPAHRNKADYLKGKLGECCIDLTGRASQVEAFQIISFASLMLSEDSGLMHMAWVQGIPTIALFSSSRKDWSGPQGERSICLDSSDLACGPCDLKVCKFNDNRCLTRFDPGFVVARAKELRSTRMAV